MNRTTNDNKTGKKYLNLKAKMKNPSKSAGNNWVFTAPAGLGWCGKRREGISERQEGPREGRGQLDHRMLSMRLPKGCQPNSRL